MKKKYYVIQNNGYVFTSWKECQKYIKGRNVSFKGFMTMEECEAFSLTHKCQVIHKVTKSILQKNTMTEVIIKRLGKKHFDSHLERTVALWLTSNNIAFKTQLDTLKCINPLTGNVLPYDFELTDYKIIIEVQGKQHYEVINKYITTDDKLAYQQKKDEIKRQYAITNGYIFIELPYTVIEDGSYTEIIRKRVIQAGSRKIN